MVGDTIDDFDRFKLFKKYFIHNNIDSIILKFNKSRKERTLICKRRINFRRKKTMITTQKYNLKRSGAINDSTSFIKTRNISRIA